MPFTITLAFFLAVVSGVFWLIAVLAEDKPEDPKSFIIWFHRIVALLAMLVFILAIRSWSRHWRLLSSGELAVAEILALLRI